MARVKRAVNAKKHHKAILEEAKGYYGDRSRTFRSANQAVQHAGVYAFRDRRARKGEMRRLWIQRINAGTRAQLQPIHRRAERRGHRSGPSHAGRSGRER
jgi:large subunit ribosomal protein L20